MKSVLIPIQPYYVFLIIAKIMGWDIGKEKTVEVRKNYPKDKSWNKIARIYCSKNKQSFNQIPKEYQPLMRQFLGKVIGEFVCERIEIFRYDALVMTYIARKYRDTNLLKDEFFKGTQVTYQEAYDYCEGMIFSEEDTDYFYGWHISDLKIYDKPKELSEFKKPCNHKNDCCTCDRYDYIGHRCYDEITRPPQSWCYVEGDDEGK